MDFGNDRFNVQEGELAGPGEDTAMVVVGQLLARLGVADGTEAEQHDAVAEWLRHHEPNRILREDLIESGFTPTAAGR